jgi:hypothetical protein
MNNPASGSAHTRTLCLDFKNPVAHTPINANTPILTGTEVEKNVKIINANQVLYQSRFGYAKATTLVTEMETITAWLNAGIFSDLVWYNWNGTTWHLDTSVTANFSDPCAPGQCGRRSLSLNQPNYVFCRGINGANGFAIYRAAAAVTPHTMSGYHRWHALNAPLNPDSNPSVMVDMVEQEPGPTDISDNTWHGHHILLGTEDEIRMEADVLGGHVTRWQDLQGGYSNCIVWQDSLANDGSAVELDGGVNGRNQIQWNLSNANTLHSVSIHGKTIHYTSPVTVKILINGSQKTQATFSSADYSIITPNVTIPSGSTLALRVTTLNTAALIDYIAVK